VMADPSRLSSNMKIARLKLPRPHPTQRQVLDNRARFNALCCGRRWGKTTIAMEAVVRILLEGKPAAWYAPTYRLLKDAWAQIKQTLEPITVRSLEAEKLEVIGGGILECWSLDKPDAGRGRAYAGVIIDEAAIVPNFEKAWEQSVRAQLSDYRGEAWFLSTPKGTASYFHALYQRGQARQPGWASWQMPTNTNPFISEEEIADAKSDMTDLAFSQEYLAQFVVWAGAVFRRIIDCSGEVLLAPAAMIGVDWGRTGDYTVFVALSATGHVIAIDRFKGIEYAQQRARLAEFWKRHGARCWIVAESNSMGGPVVEQLQADRLPVQGFLTTGPSKANIISALALAFERGTIRIPNDPVLIGELQAFEGTRTPSGFMKYGAPSGLHDDTVMALAIAWAALHGPRQQTQYLNPQTGNFGDEPSGYQISPI
jgi:Terminase RNaseH-like domain/Terminase large subunit, T4likevirus-type, N-terminal